MSAPDDIDMLECEDRNEYGYHSVNSPTTRPSATVNAGSAPSQTKIDQQTKIDNSVNKALPWIAFSWFLSGGAVIGLIIWSIVAPSLIDSRIEARVAKAEAVAELARRDAAIAKDMMDVERAKRIAREESKK